MNKKEKKEVIKVNLPVKTWGDFYKLMAESLGWKEDSEYGPEEEEEEEGYVVIG